MSNRKKIMMRGMRHHWRGRRGGFPEFEGFGPRGFRSRGGRGRRRKFLDADELRLLILDLLGEEPRHGYDLIRAIEEKSDGAYAPSPGVIYPQLAMLADEGLITEAETDGARKPYRLTDEGVAIRKQSADAIASLYERFSALAESRRRFDSEPARRAIHNLHNALGALLSRKDADEELVFKAVALLDSATQQIERL